MMHLSWRGLRHATLVPPIPSLLRTGYRTSDREPAASSPIGAMDTYMPVPEGLSFDHLGGLGRACAICHFRTLSSRGAVAGCGDCDLLLPSMILLIDLHDVPPTCSDSSPELIPAAEANVAASKVPLPPHVPVPSCNHLSAAGLAPQGHSAAPCACLGSWQLCPALDSVCRTMSHPLRLGGITAHSRRGGKTSPTTSLVTTIAAWQTMPCCDALLPKRGDHSVRREAGTSAFLRHTGDACGPGSGGSDC